MLKDDINKNKAVILRAAQNIRERIKQAGNVRYQRFRGAAKSYDDRNIDHLAALMFDASQKPEEERSAYYNGEVEKLIDAFEGKRDFKPYIKRMYDSMAFSESIDWSDIKQVENMIATFQASQTLATIFTNFKKDVVSVYSKRKEIEQLDALIAKSQMTWLNVCEALTEAGIDRDVEGYVNIGLKMGGGLVGPASMVKRDISSDFYDVPVSSGRAVTIDPARSENMQRFFLGQQIDVLDQDGDPFTADDYARECIRALSSISQSTTIEQHMVKSVAASDPELDFSYSNLLFINGRSFADIWHELAAQNGYDSGNEFRGHQFAGLMLRDALTDGKSIVTLLRPSWTPDGKVKFYHQDVKVDLDKLNDIDRETTYYNPIRRFLNWVGLWKIEKYPSNKTRDERQAKIRENPQYNEPLLAAEDKIIELYNNDHALTRDNGLKDLLPKISRADHEEQENDAPSLDGNQEREPLGTLLLENHKDLPLEPPKGHDVELNKKETKIK